MSGSANGRESVILLRAGGFRDREIVLSARDGLVSLVAGEVTGQVPASAIVEVFRREGPQGPELRLRYDRNAVPELPRDIAQFSERDRLGTEIQRALHGTSEPDVILLGRVWTLGLDALFQIRRMAESGALGRWRDEEP